MPKQAFTAELHDIVYFNQVEYRVDNIRHEGDETLYTLSPLVDWYYDRMQSETWSASALAKEGACKAT